MSKRKVKIMTTGKSAAWASTATLALSVACSAFALFATSATMPLLADTYLFFPDGYSVENESYAAFSSGTALVTSTRTAAAESSDLEARYRTWDESAGTSLRSDKFRGMIIIIK